MQSLLVVEHTQIIVGEEISRLKIDGFSVGLHRIFNLMRAVISIRQVEASGKVFGIQTEGPLKLGDAPSPLPCSSSLAPTLLRSTASSDAAKVVTEENNRPESANNLQSDFTFKTPLCPPRHRHRQVGSSRGCPHFDVVEFRLNLPYRTVELVRRN
jgi:hypothetical protein